MILPDWFWRLKGPDVIETGFEPERINPTSYDLTLASKLLLQVYRGQEFRDEPAFIQGDSLWLPRFRTHVPNEFRPGDAVLASTREWVRVPRWVKLQGHLKSSLAREGLNHRTALLIDPGFTGNITLELEFKQTGKLQDEKPIIQVEAQLVFPQRHYGQLKKSHYVSQMGVTPNRNPDIAFVRT